MKIERLDVPRERASLCRDILESLPDWFGIPASIDEYVRGAAEQEMLIGRVADEARPIGFLSLRFHTPVAAEAYVLGVRREWHRHGCGQGLFAAACDLARDRGLRFLTVKTLAASHPDPNYAATRHFYEAIGFLPLEVLPTLWGPENPCLMMIRPL